MCNKVNLQFATKDLIRKYILKLEIEASFIDWVSQNTLIVKFY